LKQGNGTCDEMSSLFKQRVTAESQHSKLHQLGWTSAQEEKQHSEHLIRLDQKHFENSETLQIQVKAACQLNSTPSAE